MKDDEFKPVMGLYSDEVDEAFRAFRSRALMFTLPPSVLRQLRDLRLKQESLRWATDPLGLMICFRDPVLALRRTVARMFWGVARFCDRCCEILEE